MYDRGYPCFDFIFEHQQKEIDFVIRAKTSWSNVIKAFVASDLDSEQVLLQIGKNQSVKGKRYDHKTELSVRLVRVILSSGETEILITSLVDENQYPTSEFKWLYFQRWGIETRYDVLKNSLKIENFSGISELTIEQDFFITLLIANMEAILREEVNQQIKERYKDRTYQYKVNISACVCLLRDKITELLLGQDPQAILNYLTRVFAQHTQPIRPDRSFPRKKTSIEPRKNLSRSKIES